MVKKTQSGILADLIRSNEELLALPGKHIHDKWLISAWSEFSELFFIQ